jgi:hypothetical protein
MAAFETSTDFSAQLLHTCPAAFVVATTVLVLLMPLPAAVSLIWL